MKQRIFEILEKSKKGDTLSYLFDLLIIVLIIINVSIIFIATMKIDKRVLEILYWIDIIISVIFVIEYLLRIYTADLLYPHKNKLRARLKYIFSPIAIIDLLAIMPLVGLIFGFNRLKSLKVIRAFRMLRLLKANRYNNSLNLILKVLSNKKEELIASISIMMIILFFSGYLMYEIESPHQPEAFTNAFDGIWWSIATLTTVGYGDIYPVSSAGRLVSAFVVILGIGLVAIPTGILASGFTQELSNKNEKK